MKVSKYSKESCQGLALNHVMLNVTLGKEKETLTVGGSGGLSSGERSRTTFSRLQGWQNLILCIRIPEIINITCNLNSTQTLTSWHTWAFSLSKRPVRVHLSSSERPPDLPTGLEPCLRHLVSQTSRASRQVSTSSLTPWFTRYSSWQPLGSTFTFYFNIAFLFLGCI